MARRAVLAVIALVAVTTAVGAAGSAVAAPKPAALPTIVSSTRATVLALPAPGTQIVQSIALTKGLWTVMANATADSPAGGSDFFRCELVDISRGLVLDGATTFLNPSITLDVITNLTVIKVTGHRTVAQECSHDGTGGDAGGIDAGASLVGFASATSGVRIASTKQQTPLTDTGNADVVDLSLPKGTWVVAARVTPVVLSSPQAEVTCSDDTVSGGVARLLGTEPGTHAVSTIFKAGSVATLKKAGTVTLACGEAGGDAYLDPGAELWAWKASDLKLADESPCPVTISATVETDALVLRQNQFCPIGPGPFASEMIGARLSAGAWVAFGGVDDPASQGANTARCEVLEPAHNLLLDESSATLSQTTGFPITGITNLAVATVKKKLLVTGVCGEDSVGASGTSVASEWVFIRP